MPAWQSYCMCNVRLVSTNLGSLCRHEDHAQPRAKTFYSSFHVSIGNQLLLIVFAPGFIKYGVCDRYPDKTEARQT
jgi:hypothetical protein